MAKKIVIADASPLIAFGRVNLLSLVTKVLGSIIIPEAVARECTVELSRPGASAIQQAIDKKIITVHANPDVIEYQSLRGILGEGEASAIALALKLHTGLLIDERLGRAAAMNLHVKIIGTAGVLLLAKQRKLINKVSPILNELKQSGYYLSDELIVEVMRRAREKVL